MRSFAALLAAFAILAAASSVAAVANVPEIVPVSSLPWSLSFVRSYYHSTRGVTVYEYSVVTQPGASDLGHITIGATGCSGVTPGANWLELAVDPVSGVNGYSSAWGVEAGNTVVLALELQGEQGLNAAGEFALHGGGLYGTDSIAAPDCSAVTAYPTIQPLPAAAQTIGCGDDFSTEFPAGCAASNDCYEIVSSTISTANSPCEQEPVNQVTVARSVEIGGVVFTTRALFTVTKNDNTAPTLTLPLDLSVECDDLGSIPPAGPLSYTDDCGSSGTVEPCLNRTDTHCPQHYYLLRSWTPTDECGNNECYTQTITVRDTGAPSLHGVVPSYSVKCEAALANPALVAKPVVTADDSCAGDLTGEIESGTVHVPGECPNTYETRWTWAVRDPCGNRAQNSTVVTVYDDTAPAFVGVNESIPEHRTISCDKLADDEDITAQDACAGIAYPVVYTELPDTSAFTCAQKCSYSLTRTWTVEDDCGNSRSLVRTLLVQDKSAPTFTLDAEGPVTVECDNVPPQRPEPADDLCDPAVTEATCTEHRTDTPCSTEYVLNRTCTITDCCGNTVSRSRLITVIDSNLTKPAQPESVTFQCNGIVPIADLVVPAQPCGDISVTQSSSESRSDPDAQCGFTITRTWTFSDCAGNSDTIVQTYPVVDSTPPVFDACPTEPIVATCTLPPAAQLTASDNCSTNVGVTSVDVDTSAPCYGRRSGSRTYTADDNCGHTTTCVVPYTVDDSTAPVWTFFPADQDLNCQDPVVIQLPTAADSCSNATVTLVSDVRVNNSATCTNAYVRTLTYKATDSCGNELGPRAQVIRVVDNTPPTFSLPRPANHTEECDAISCPDDVTASDNCDGLLMTYAETRVADPAQYSCAHIEEIHRTWTITDQCGNTDSHLQVITVFDAHAPVYNGSDLAPIEVPCYDSDTYVPPSGPERDWSDNCGPVTFVNLTKKVTPGECLHNTTATYTWLVRDSCGNYASVSKPVKFYDTFDPEIDEVPDKAVDCKAPASEWPGEPGVYDSCGNVPEFTLSNSSVETDCLATGHLRQYTFTWTATDFCMNTVTRTYRVNVTDNTPPEMTCPERNLIGTCTYTPPLVNLTATDACTGAVTTVVPVETRINGGCANNFTLHRVWTATDSCGNPKVCEQDVTFSDSTPPEISGIPNATVTAQCDAVPKPVDACATDNCSPLQIRFDEVKEVVGCPQQYNLVRTWNAVDACGNTDSGSYNVSVTDSKNPYWTSPLPMGSDLECDKNAATPSFGKPTCGDDCSVTNVTAAPTVTNGACAAYDRIYSFSWTCDDGCGNAISHSTTTTVTDNTPPTFVWPNGVPSATITYGACEEPNPSDVGASDACTGTNTTGPTASNYVQNASCPYQQSWTNTWTASDECDHTITHTQDVTVSRPGPPTIVPDQLAAHNRSCRSAAPGPAAVKAFDACNVELAVTPTSGTVSIGCNGDETDETRTWTATDSCGQVVTVVQHLYVNDLSPPDFAVPPPRNTHNVCDRSDVDAPEVTSKTDDCDDNVEVTHDLPVITGTSCSPTYTWTYTATDNCGKTTQKDFSETYTYDLVPQVTSSHTDNLPFECESSLPPFEPVSWETGCGAPLASVTPVETDGPKSCPDRFTRTYTHTVTDECGLNNTFALHRVVGDNTPPTITFEWEPKDENVECPFLPPAPRATASDNCGRDVTLELLEFKTPLDGGDCGSGQCDCCNYHLRRVWRATDACGLETVRHQNVYVRDTIPPVWTSTSNETEVTVTCPAKATPPVVTWAEAAPAVGFCAAAAASTGCTPSGADLAPFQLGGHAYTLESGARFVRWLNGYAFLTGTVAQVADPSVQWLLNLQFTRGDVTGADADAQLTDALDASCYGAAGIQLDQWRFYRQVEGNLTLVSDPATRLDVAQTSVIQLGLGASGLSEEYSLRFTFSAAGAGAGSSETGSVQLALDRCDTSSWNFPELLCGPITNINATNETTTECPGRYTTVYTYTAADASGNSNSTTYTVHSIDNTPPVFDAFPALVTGLCAPPAPVDPTAQDSCSNVTVTGPVKGPETLLNDSVVGCPFNYQFDRTWTAVDECENPATIVQHVEVSDVTPPTVTLTNVPDNKNYQCRSQIPAAADAVCEDNCSGVLGCTTQHVVPPGSGNCGVTYTYHWTAEDQCQNFDQDSYQVTVQDTTAPVCKSGYDCTTRTVNVTCNDVINVPPVVYTDNCDGDLTVTPVAGQPYSSCPTLIDYVFTVEDACGNDGASFTVTVAVYDLTPPTIVVPANRTIGNCDYDAVTGPSEVASGAASADDNCLLESFSWTRDVPTYDGECLTLVTRTFTARDACGNEHSAHSYIKVDDNTAPAFSPASIADDSVSCADAVPCAPNVTITDGCPNVLLSYAETSVTGSCPQRQVITRTWTGSDACGNADTLSYTINVTDDVPPTWVEPEAQRPQNLTGVQCNAVPPASKDDLHADDDCSVAPVNFTEVRVNGSCADSYRLERTWTASDACGNSIRWYVEIEVVDTTDPTFTEPLSASYECNKLVTVPDFDTVTFDDNCDDDVASSYTDSTVGDECDYTKTRSWTASDNCGNEVSASQSIRVHDFTPPTFTVTLPPTDSFECQEGPLTPVGATDSCGSAVANYTEVSTPASPTCPHPFTVVRTYNAYDGCGHNATQVRTVTVSDTLPPTLSFTGEYPESNTADAPFQCNYVDVPAVGAAFDQCQGNLNADVVFVEGPKVGTACEYSITRTWNVQDCAGNAAPEVSQTLYFKDTAPPVFDTPPTLPPLDCTAGVGLADLPSRIGQLGYVDPVCGDFAKRYVDPELTFSFINPVFPLCVFNFSFNATWTATDDCGNTAVAMATYDVLDQTPPEIIFHGEFENLTLPCGSIPVDPSTGAYDWSTLIADYSCDDNCDDGGSGANPRDVTTVEVPDGDNCPHTKLFVQTYFCSDLCNHTVTATRTIRVGDTVPPVIDQTTLPPSRTTECNSSADPDDGFITVPGTLGGMATYGLISNANVGTGACKSSPAGFAFSTLAHGQSSVNPKWYDFSLVEPKSDNTWQVLDYGAATQRIVFNGHLRANQNSAFTFDLLATFDRFVPAGHLPCESGYATPPNGDCTSPKLEFANPACNSAGADTDPANFEYYTRLVNARLVGTGSCSGAVVTLTQRGPSYQVGTGANGKNANYGSSGWVFWSVTTQPADASACPIAARFSSASWGDINIDMSVSDDGLIPSPNCTDQGISTVNYTDVRTNGNCTANYRITRTYLAYDCAGQVSAPVTRTFDHFDTRPPVISGATLPATQDCAVLKPGGTEATASPTALDLCQGSLPVSGPTLVSTEGNTCNLTKTYRWTAVDECGNQASATAPTSFLDTKAPTFAEPGAVTTACCNAVPQVPDSGLHTAEDDCSSVSTSFLGRVRKDGRCKFEYELLSTWTGTDACGQQTNLTDTVQVSDCTPPTIVPTEYKCHREDTQSIYQEIVMADLSGVLFTVDDECSATEDLDLDIIGCSSDQDVDTGATPRDGSFTSDCYFDAASRSLFIKLEINVTKLEGRLFTIQGRVTDECGNSALANQTFLVTNLRAVQPDSFEIRNLSYPTDSEACTPLNLCTEDCPPCIYDIDYCEDASAAVGTIALSSIAYSEAADATTVVYGYSAASGGSVARATVGLNLAHVEILSFSANGASAAADPRRNFGFQRNSFVSGLSWFPADASGSVTVVLRGNWTFEEGTSSVPFELEWSSSDDEACSAGTVAGPCVRHDSAVTSISGTVAVTGTVFGPRGESSKPLDGVVVKLTNGNALAPTVLAYATTNKAGEYRFTNLPSAVYEVVVDEEGLLAGNLQGAHRYITTDTNALVYKYGEPRALPAVPETGVDFGVLINERKWDQASDRARYNEPGLPVIIRGRENGDTNFNGNSKSVNFWTEQVRLRVAGHSDQLLVRADLLAAYLALADAKLADAGFDSVASVLLGTGSSAYQKRVVALLLNEAAGFGVFRPYAELQTLVLHYVLAAGPAPSAGLVASNDALVIKMLSAN